MAINLRSPYYISISSSTISYAILKLYIWTGNYSLQPSEYEFEIQKSALNNEKTIYFEISELVKDFLDNKFDGNYNSDAVWVKAVKAAYNSSGNQIGSDTESDFLGFDSYSYFEEQDFDIDNQTIMISNRKIYGLADSSVRIPINTERNPTVTFIKDNEVINSQSFSSSVITNLQVEYVTVNGATFFDNYKERVLNTSGTYEDNSCIRGFLNDFEIGEVDRITVSDDSGYVGAIDVQVLNECKYTPKKITFINKFGAFQDMYFFKKSVEKMNVKKETYKSNIIDGDSYDRYNHVNRDFNVVGKESVTLSSGFLNEEYNEVFKQLMLSEKVWMTEITDTEELVLPINVKTSNITYKTSVNDKLVEYTIEFDRSYDVINNIR